MADFSKAFDTVVYDTFLCKLRKLGFSKSRLSTWSSRCNLALHPKKTKVMLLSTPQMSQTHGLDGHCIHLCANGKSLQRVLTFHLL
ncbi:unnamed protein product, partial [Porites lobata]